MADDQDYPDAQLPRAPSEFKRSYQEGRILGREAERRARDMRAMGDGSDPIEPLTEDEVKDERDWRKTKRGKRGKRLAKRSTRR